MGIAKKAIATVATATYTLSPIDVVPDVIPAIGWLDDLIIIVIYINYMRSLLSMSKSS